MKATGHGFWELNLADGTTWFSEWFYERLQWPQGSKRSTFGDLRCFVSPDTWDQLLGDLRAHLERRIPLDAEFQLQLADGRIARWQLRGLAQLNAVGHPIHLAGSVRDVTAESGHGASP